MSTMANMAFFDFSPSGIRVTFNGYCQLNIDVKDAEFVDSDGQRWLFWKKMDEKKWCLAIAVNGSDVEGVKAKVEKLSLMFRLRRLNCGYRKYGADADYFQNVDAFFKAHGKDYRQPAEKRVRIVARTPEEKNWQSDKFICDNAPCCPFADLCKGAGELYTLEKRVQERREAVAV